MYELIAAWLADHFLFPFNHLQDFITNKRVRLNAAVGLFAANSAGDDIELYDSDTPEARSGAPKAKFHGLRQQVGSACSCGCLAILSTVFLCMSSLSTVFLTMADPRRAGT